MTSSGATGGAPFCYRARCTRLLNSFVTLGRLLNLSRVREMESDGYLEVAAGIPRVLIFFLCGDVICRDDTVLSSEKEL